jgi:uncharacterized membrane protein
MGLVSTFLLVLIPIIFGIASGTLLGSSPSENLYLTSISIISNIVLFVLFFMSMKGFSEYYEDSRIFKNSLYAVIVSCVGIISSPILLHFMRQFQLHPILMLILSFGFPAIFGILTAVFFRGAFNALAEKSNEQNFKYAAWLIFIGGILTIIIIGIFIVFIGRMFAVLGFYSMKQKSSQTSNLNNQQN